MLYMYQCCTCTKHTCTKKLTNVEHAHNILTNLPLFYTTYLQTYLCGTFTQHTYKLTNVVHSHNILAKLTFLFTT